MSKSIYEEALEDLKKLIEQANARKLSNEIVANRWGVERITKIIEQAKKQEKLLELYKELNNKRKELIVLARHNKWSWDLDIEIKDIEDKIKELENE